MGYAQYGVDDGFPIVNAHGGLACRLDVAAAEPVAVGTGIRLISPDRPGVGLSDPQPGRTILDWAHDVEELLEQVDVDRFPSWAGRWADSTPRRSVTRCGAGSHGWRSSRAHCH
jgi:pimeloyl-ACP methyl ester carboxylesterase